MARIETSVTSERFKDAIRRGWEAIEPETP